MEADKIMAGDGAARAWGPGNREWWYPRVLTIALITLGAASLWIYQHRNDTLRTQRLEIVDGHGKLCAVLGAMPGSESGIGLQDAQGQTRATLTVGADGNPALALCSPDGMERAGLAISPKGNSTLRLFSDYGQVRVALQVDRDGKIALKLDDPKARNKTARSYNGNDTPTRTASKERSESRTLTSPWHATSGKPKPQMRVSMFTNGPGGIHGLWTTHSSAVAD